MQRIHLGNYLDANTRGHTEGLWEKVRLSAKSQQPSGITGKES